MVRDRDKYLAIFAQLQQCLTDCNNSYLVSFLSVREVIQQMNVPPEKLKIAIHAERRPSGEHIRRFNLPECSEISILMPNDVTANQELQVVCAYRGNPGSNTFERLSDTHR